MLWVPDGDEVRPITVQAGTSDGFRTVVTGKDLSEGTAVVTGMQAGDAGDGDARNPFAPQFPRRSPKSGQDSR